MAPFPLYTWDLRLQRYRSKRTGRLIPQTAVRHALDAALENERRRARSLADQLRRGQITSQEWHLRMRETVKATQLFSAAAGKGGWGQLTPADYGLTGAGVREQYGYLDQFATQVRAGLPLDGRFLARAESYALAGRRTFNEVERDVRLAAGATEVRSVLHPADHCEGPGSCVEQRDLDWQPAASGLITAPGTRLCGNRCRCTLEYRGAA